MIRSFLAAHIFATCTTTIRSYVFWHGFIYIYKYISTMKRCPNSDIREHSSLTRAVEFVPLQDFFNMNFNKRDFSQQLMFQISYLLKWINQNLLSWKSKSAKLSSPSSVRWSVANVSAILDQDMHPLNTPAFTELIKLKFSHRIRCRTCRIGWLMTVTVWPTPLKHRCIHYGRTHGIITFLLTCFDRVLNKVVNRSNECN